MQRFLGPEPTDVRRSLAEIGFNRGSRLGGAHGPSHREWLHFCVHAPGVDLVANFSAFPARDARRGGVIVPRLTLLARDQDGWAGALDTFEADEHGLPGGRFGARMGRSVAALTEDGLQLRIGSACGRISAALVLVPSAGASPSHNVQVGGSPPLNWVVVPRLSARGWIRVRDREHRVDAAPAYHDHNWGAFRWGADFRWEWGYAIAREIPWAIVAVRLTNRARTVVLEQGVLVWHGARLLRTFRGDDVRYRCRGLARIPPALRIPAALALTRPGSASDVPRESTFEARSGDDHLELAFQPLDLAQLLVPDDVGPSVTVVNEVRCSVRARGMVSGRELAFETGGFLELLGR